MLHCILSGRLYIKYYYSILHGVFTVFAVRMGNCSSLVDPLQFQFSIVRRNTLGLKHSALLMLYSSCIVGEEQLITT